MLINKKLFLSLILTLICTFQVSAASITLKDGRVFEGQVKTQDAQKVVLDMNGLEMTLPIEQISAIDLSEAAPAPVVAAATPVQGVATIPAGTAFMVRISEGFNSRHNSTGQRFTAVLEGNLMAGNIIVAPKGSQVYGVLTEVKRAGRVAGSAILQFQLNEISVNNIIYPISTQTIRGKGANEIRSTAGKTARAALIGGLIDGSDGAKTGAKVGVGVALLTKGHDIQVAAGDLQEFILSTPFTPQ